MTSGINNENEMKDKELRMRTKEFAHQCVKLSMGQPNTQLGKHIRGQLIHQ
jgi:hypothetical protein